MVAVYIFFAIGILATLIALVPAFVEVYARLYSYFATLKKLSERRKELREDKINDLKLKDIELEDKEEVKIEDLTEDEIKAIEPKEEINVAELAKEIVNK